MGSSGSSGPTWGQSPSINRDRDRGGRESVDYCFDHCTFAYQEESIMGAQKITYSGLLGNLNSDL